MTLNRAALRASQPRTILATRPPYPPFWKTYRVSSALYDLGGPAPGEGAAEQEGEQVRSLGVKDPGDAIAAALMGGLVKRFALQVKTVGEPQTLGTSTEDLSAEYQHTDLVLDVRTIRWGVSPTSATRYAIFYQGRLRLIDTRRRAILAEGICDVPPDHQPNDPSYDALMWNNATILKEKIPKLIQGCIDDYRTRILGLTTQDMGKSE